MLSRNSTNLVSGPETERKKVVKDIQTNEIYQENFLKTKYSCDLIKNVKRKTEENFHSIYTNNRSDIFYLNNIVFKSHKDLKEKVNITKPFLNESNKKREALPKIKSQIKFSNGGTKKNTQDFKKMDEKPFTQTMENYYSKLSHLKPHSSNKIKLEPQNQDEKFMKKNSPSFRISVMFGKNQLREPPVNEELSIFKNLHTSGDKLSPEKNNFSSFLNLSKRKTPSVKSYEIIFKKKEKSEQKSIKSIETAKDR